MLSDGGNEKSFITFTYFQELLYLVEETKIIPCVYLLKKEKQEETLPRPFWIHLKSICQKNILKESLVLVKKHL